MAKASNFKKTFNLDQGTSCGSAYADIAVLKLKKTASYYANNYGPFNLAELRSELKAHFGPVAHHNYIIFVDQATEASYGIADIELDDQAGPANKNNRAGKVAALWASKPSKA